jgi:hypothetical protein
LVAGTQLTFQAEVPWHLISANGFDGPHFEHVHGRRPLRPSTHSAPHSDAFVVEHDLDIVGQGWADRFLRWVDGGPIRMRYEVWGGHSVLAEMRFRRMTSRLVIYILPDGPGRSLVRMWPLSHSRLDLPLRCWLTRSFFEHEFREIRGAKLHPASLTPADHGQEAFLDWLASRLQDQNRIE